MYFIFQILPKLMIIPTIIYFYFYFKRILKFFGIQETYLVKIGLMILSVIFVYPASYLFGFWAVVVFHIMAFSIVMDIIYLIFHNHKIFNQIYHIGIIPILCLFIVLGYGYWNIHNVQQTHYTLYTDKDISQDYKIILMTDLHFGNTMNQKELLEYCQEISHLSPDIVLLGGDIVDERSTSLQMKEAFETLGDIQNKHGIYYVYGNHDPALYSTTPPYTVEELKQTIEDNDIHILLDNHLTIQEELTLIGRRDRSDGQRIDSRQLLNQIDDNDFLLLLDHQPVDLEVNDQLEYDLQLSGHTHAGQMFPVGLISDLLGFGEMNYGYRQMKHMQVIVSSGMAGWGYPLRTGAHSEYVIIDLIKQ